MDTVSVGATINTLAAVKAKGRTIIENACWEPEIIDVATLLNNMGHPWAGTDIITWLRGFHTFYERVNKYSWPYWVNLYRPLLQLLVREFRLIMSFTESFIAAWEMGVRIWLIFLKIVFLSKSSKLWELQTLRLLLIQALQLTYNSLELPALKDG